jgi:hypothetical protein
MSGLPIYREYECNLSAPYVRGWKGIRTPLLIADQVSAGSYINLPPKDPEFNHTICTGVERDVSAFTIGPDMCPDLAKDVVAGIFEMVCISDTTTGWFRGWIRGTAGQLTVNTLESVPINYLQKVGTMNLNTVTVDLNVIVGFVEWKITIYNRS